MRRREKLTGVQIAMAVFILASLPVMLILILTVAKMVG